LDKSEKAFFDHWQLVFS